jgi:phosphate transport system permease protein
MAAIDHTRPLTPTGNLRRRRATDRFMRYGCTLAAAMAVALLIWVVFSIVQRGASAISWSFLTQNAPTTFGVSAVGGGIGNAIIGTAMMVAVATAIALPFGLLIAVFLTEFASPRVAGSIRLALDLLYGLPSIVIALFLYGLLVVGNGQAGVYVSFALAIIMMPLIARTTSESLLLVPKELRDASHALGISRWRTTIGIVIPGALGGVITGTILAVARAGGETAPVLLLSSLANTSTTSFSIFSQPLNNIPYDIFNFSEEGGAANIARAWGAALVMIFFVLVLNLVARTLQSRRNRRMMSR